MAGQNTVEPTVRRPGDHSPRTAVLDWIVLKVTQRCNLDCDYCYVYNRGDTSWRSRPAYISDDVVRALAGRIGEHCRRYALQRFVVELHGGEPLLLGKRRMQSLIDTVRTACPGIDVRFVLQTNGLLLDERWLAFFARNGMTFGLSLDGPPELADRHRTLRNGKGTTRKLLDVVESLRAAPAPEGASFDDLFGGVLCVVDPSAHGGSLVRWFRDHGFRNFDLLLPDGTHANPPGGWRGAGEYLRFLLEAFDEWYRGGADGPRIRLFEVMMLGLLGERPVLDALGGDLNGLCVVESDGSIGIHDVLRMCLGTYSADTLNVFDHTLDSRGAHYRIGEIQKPCETCLGCPFFASCRGGYLPHRFDGSSFDNPSMYCAALYGLSERMLEVLREEIPGGVWHGPQLAGPVSAHPHVGPLDGMEAR